MKCIIISLLALMSISAFASDIHCFFEIEYKKSNSPRSEYHDLGTVGETLSDYAKCSVCKERFQKLSLSKKLVDTFYIDGTKAYKVSAKNISKFGASFVIAKKYLNKAKSCYLISDEFKEIDAATGNSLTLSEYYGVN